MYIINTMENTYSQLLDLDSLKTVVCKSVLIFEVEIVQVLSLENCDFIQNEITGILICEPSVFYMAMQIIPAY